MAEFMTWNSVYERNWRLCSPCFFIHYASFHLPLQMQSDRNASFRTVYFVITLILTHCRDCVMYSTRY